MNNSAHELWQYSSIKNHTPNKIVIMVSMHDILQSCTHFIQFVVYSVTTAVVLSSFVHNTKYAMRAGLNNEYLNLINRIVRTFSWTLLPSVFASVRNLCDKYLSMLLLARIENELSFGRRSRRCRVPDTARYATDYNRNWMPPNEFIYFIYYIELAVRTHSATLSRV